jgi:hypothetical protein
MLRGEEDKTTQDILNFFKGFHLTEFFELVIGIILLVYAGQLLHRISSRFSERSLTRRLLFLMPQE